MEQLILIGVILLFSSVLDAVARKNKRREAESGEGPPTVPPAGTPGPPRPSPRERAVPTYDQDPSFDDAVEAESSSEGMIPADVWAEIQALARGDKTPAPAPARTPRPARSPAPVPAPQPAPEPPTSATRRPRAEPSPTPSPSPARRRSRPPPAPEVPVGGAVAAPEHSVHLTHQDYGTPVRDRLTGFDDDAPRRGLSTDGRAVRNVLRGRGAGLRQAVLLQEILGPPVSLKDDPSAG